MQRPNIVFIHTDQQRWDAIAAAGNPHVITPNLDRLARSGALLTGAFCNSPLCAPSRQSMLSGRYPSAFGGTANGIVMPEDVPMMPHLLRPYGYRSCAVGKLHLINVLDRDHREPHPMYGFDEMINADVGGVPGFHDAYAAWVESQRPGALEQCWQLAASVEIGPPERRDQYAGWRPYVFQGPEELTHTAFVADQTGDFIRRAGDAPFFVSAGFFAPHDPFWPPPRFIDMYDPSKLPAPHMTESQRERFGLSDDEWRIVRQHYYALITHLDDQLGRILDALDETGVRERTLIVFTSDHGENLGDHGRGGKGMPGWDSQARIPLIVSWPDGIEGGLVSDAFVEGVDILPTMLDCAGIQIPPFCQGRTLRPLLEGREHDERESVYMELKIPFKQSHRSVRTRDYLYCAGWTEGEHEEELYDLRSDPHQLHDVAEAPESAGLLADARRELIRRAFEAECQYPRKAARY